jgi:hypothetical protein
MKEFKVFELTIDDLQYLHLASDHSFFKCGEEDENGDDLVVPTMTQRGDKYLYGVTKFTQRFPDVDISGLTQIEFVPDNDGI